MSVRLTTAGSTRFLTQANDSFVGKSLEVYGEWSYGEVILLSKLLRSGGNVVEIGANIGAHTLFIARDICPSGTVYAFEPRRLLFQMLCANLALNGVSNVHAFQKAAGRESRSLSEGAPPDTTIANLGGFTIGAIAGEGEIIEIVPVDDMLDVLKPISLLKVDVEGWERDVLLGARKLIARDRPILYVENDRVDASRDLITYITEMSYHMWWHIVPLFRPDNRACTRANIFGKICSFNMLCLPHESKIKVTGLPKVEDPGFHPLQRKAKAVVDSA